MKTLVLLAPEKKIMKKRFILALLLATSAPAVADVLTTTFGGGNSHAGIMYDIVADKPLSISAIQFASDITSAGIVEIYTKGGTHVGFEGSSTAWGLVVSAPYEAGPASVAKAPVVFPSALLVSPGESRAFYIRQTVGSLSYSIGDGVGTTEADDGTLRILEGTGIGGLFGADFAKRVPNVTMHYSRIPNVLTTTFKTNNTNNGIVFDVVATNALTIEALEFPMTGAAGDPFAAQIYSKAGSHVGFDSDPTAWSLVGSNTAHVVLIGTATVRMSLPTPISIPQGGRRAFYLTSPDNFIRYSSGGPETFGNPEASDENLTILKGRTMGALFSGAGNSRVPAVAFYYRDADRFAPELTIIGKRRIRATGPRAKIFGVASDDVALAGVQATYRRAKGKSPGRQVTQGLPLGSSGLFFLNLKLAPGRNLVDFTASDASGRSSAPVRVTVQR